MATARPNSGNFGANFDRTPAPHRSYLGLILTTLLLIGGGVWIFSKIFSPAEPPIQIVADSADRPPLNKQTQVSSATSSAVLVDVAGAVLKPGVYELPPNARVKDALAVAGGLRPDAAADWVAQKLNLAAKLRDGVKLYIPSEEEFKNDPAKFSSPAAFGKTAGSTIAGSTSTLASSEEANSCFPVNINSASAATLADCLPGIGPAYAQRIIEYREAHGGFKSIAEIQNVRGIGPKTFERIKDLITID